MDHWIMQFKSFHWCNHHGIWAIIPRPANMVRVRITFCSVFSFFSFFLVFYIISIFLVFYISESLQKIQTTLWKQPLPRWTPGCLAFLDDIAVYSSFCSKCLKEVLWLILDKVLPGLDYCSSTLLFSLLINNLLVIINTPEWWKELWWSQSGRDAPPWIIRHPCHM